jgi:hypothetical protein
MSVEKTVNLATKRDAKSAVLMSLTQVRAVTVVSVKNI